jgi:hypothetical protein
MFGRLGMTLFARFVTFASLLVWIFLISACSTNNNSPTITPSVSPQDKYLTASAQATPYVILLAPTTIVTRYLHGINPPDGASNVTLSPTFSWSPVQGASEYNVVIYSDLG